MKFLKNNLLAIAVILYFHSAWSMEEGNRLSDVPEAAVFKIFGYLDIPDARRLAKSAKYFYSIYAKQKENLWASTAKDHFGKYAEDLKGTNTWEELIKSIYLARKFAQHTLDMKAWTKEEIEFANADMANSVTSNLLVNIEFDVIQIAASLKVRSVKDFYRFLTAYYVMYLNAAKAVASNIAIDATENRAVVEELAEKDAWNSAKSVVYFYTVTLEFLVPLATVWQAVRPPVIRDSSGCDFALDALKSALAKLERKDVEEIAYSALKLSSFFVLASITQNLPVKENLAEDYRGTNGNSLSIQDQINEEIRKQYGGSKEKILKRLSSIWERNELLNNPHIHSFKKIVEILAKHVED